MAKKKKKKAKYSGIGGQAVMEGIMMRNKNRYALAVRKPNKQIEVVTGDCGGGSDKGIMKVPFIRGVFAFIDSLELGMKTLSQSAEFYVGDEEEETGFDRFLTKLFGSKAESVINAITIVFALLLAVGLFFVLPAVISKYVLERFIANASLVIILEGLVRIVIFVGYILIISLSGDIKRTFMYHGAEHKCINCIESGKALNVKNVMHSSRRHRRCGTSFVLFIMMLSVVLFFFIRVDSAFLRFGIRLLLIPVIAGLSYELLRLMGKYDNWLTKAISAPGLWFQSLTTREPDEQMAEVAIKAVEAVFDWQQYLKENFGYVPSGEEMGWLDDDDDEDVPEQDSHFETEAESVTESEEAEEEFEDIEEAEDETAEFEEDIEEAEDVEVAEEAGSENSGED